MRTLQVRFLKDRANLSEKNTGQGFLVNQKAHVYFCSFIKNQ